MAAPAGPCPACDEGEDAPALADVLLGLTVGGRFRVLRRLGQGGSGTTYLAELPSAGPRVSLKVFHPALADRAELVRSVLEAPARLADISHPALVRLHDAGKDTQGRLFLVHEHVEGTSLAAQLRARGRLGLREAVERVYEVAEALSLAHSCGAVHGGLTAESVLVRSEPVGGARVAVLGMGVLAPGQRVLLVDARLERVECLAPEQLRGGRLDVRVDVHALGALLFTLLTGHAPSRAEGSSSVPSLTRAAPDVALPALDAVLQRATARTSSERFPSARAFADALREALPASTPPTAAQAEAETVVEETVVGMAPVPTLPRDLEATLVPFAPQLPAGAHRVGLVVAGVLGAGMGAWLLLGGAGLQAREIAAAPPRVAPVVTPAAGGRAGDELSAEVAAPEVRPVVGSAIPEVVPARLGRPAAVDGGTAAEP